MTDPTGYIRDDGRPGIRNNLLVVATVSCVNHVVGQLAARTGAIPLIHDYGCLEFPESLAQTRHSLEAACSHPNTGAVLVVGLGCEQLDARELSGGVRGRPARHLVIQEEGGSGHAVEKGVKILGELQEAMRQTPRGPVEPRDLMIGVVCGASDWTTAIVSNPVVGAMADLHTRAGGGIAMTETSGIPGTEEILARRAADPEVARKIRDLSLHHVRQAAQRHGCPIYQINPTPGNKAGGITTMVEKGLGNIAKVGEGTIRGVVGWGQPMEGPDVWIMKDSGIGPDVFSISGLSLGGCQLVVFTTGSGSPLGGALAPVIKVTGNPDTAQSFAQNIDFDAGGVVAGSESIPAAGMRLYEQAAAVCRGERTRAEQLGHREFGIPRPE